ncbi:MAG: hypothetical protein OEV59_03140 [Deltaproteobacteria bacterium]|nr:hypothetical protein [Deltaproteobacteria bacterium]
MAYNRSGFSAAYAAALFALCFALSACAAATTGAKTDKAAYPCASISPEQYGRCGCAPIVSDTIDMLAASKLPENAKISVEECISGSNFVGFNISHYKFGNIEADLNNCVSKRVVLDDQVIAVLAGVVERITDQSAGMNERMCNWNKCVYGPHALCAGVVQTDTSVKVILENGNELRDEYNRVVNAHKAPYTEAEFARLGRLIEVVRGVDQDNGHVYYFGGEMMRALGRAEEAKGLYYKYIEVSETEAHSLKKANTSFLSCYDNPKGVCRQRTGWVHHLLANYFYDKWKAEKNAAEKAGFAANALKQARLALEFYPSGFEQFTDTNVIIKQITK